MDSQPIAVMLVDDHPVVRAGYARLIEQARDIRLVAEAGSGSEALRLVRRQAAAQVIVTDLSMPGTPSGIELISSLRSLSPSCAVLVFSMYDGTALVRRAIQAGAMGFLSKRDAPGRLVGAIRSVHAGLKAVSPHLEAALLAPPSGDGSSILAELNERELALLTLLAQGHPIGECARLLDLSPKTASNYQSLLREKLGVSTSAGMAHLALRWGLIEPEPQ